MEGDKLKEKRDKMMRPGRILKTLRKSVNARQQDIAMWLGIETARYSRIENGKLPVYAYEWLEIIETLGHKFLVIHKEHVVKEDDVDRMDVAPFADGFLRVINSGSYSDKLTDDQKRAIIEAQKKINEGYELRMIRGRGGSRLKWIKPD